MNNLVFNTPTYEDTQIFPAQKVFDAGIKNHHIANTAYPIAHLQTMMDYRIPDSDKYDFARNIWNSDGDLGLYIHIPFCENRCRFCEYTVIDPDKNSTNEDLYFSKLLKEFELYKNQTGASNKKIIGFDIGGGTPSLPDSRHIESVINTANKTFNISSDVDISIETTPKIAANDYTKMKSYKDMGIRRISMGVQSITASVLENAGRTNTSISRNNEAVANIRKAGFTKFNIDIMYGLVGQTVENLRATIMHVLDLNPEFITIYRTRYKGTRMAEDASKITIEDINTQQRAIKEILVGAGYDGALGKNTFSKIDGNVGTSDYLTKRVVNGSEYLGLGLGSQSFSVKSLSYNSGAVSKRLNEYYNDIDSGLLPIQDIYHLPKVASIGKFISVSFYFGGINLTSFEQNYGMKIDEFFPDEIKFVVENGYMEFNGQYLKLTEKGVDNFNGVIALFYSPAIKDYLINRL